MAFNFYFAGAQHKTSDELLRAMNANVLRCYLNDKKTIATFIACKRSGEWKGKLLIDSGAFTAHRKDVYLDVDKYIEFLNANCDAIDYGIQVDEIPGKWGEKKTFSDVKQAPAKTWENYLYMRSKLKRPEMLLPVFHMHEDFKYLKQMLEFTENGKHIEYICISGSKDRTPKERKEWYTKVFNIIKNSSNPNVKTHCLGSATRTDMEQFPFTSSDATSWLKTSSMGGIITPYGTVCVSKNSEFSKEHINNQPEQCQEIVKQMCARYGIDYNVLPTDYKARSNFNIHYLYQMSRETSCKQTSFNRGGLF